ncbi:MAG: transglutaminase, partial [Oxalobacteraceae bacterium]
MQFAPVTAAQLLDVFRQKAIGDTFQTIDDVKWRYDQAAGASILTISGTGTFDWSDDGTGGKSLALPGGGFSPPERRVRASDQNRDAPFYTKPDYTCYVTTVRVPTSTQAKQWSSKNSFDTRMFGRAYHRAWEMRDGAIRMVRASRIEQPEIDVAAAQRDNARIAAFDNSMGW